MTQSLFFYPFEKNIIEPIKQGDVCAVIECDYNDAFRNISGLKVFNSFKPQADQWQGYEPAPLESNYYDTIFLQIPKQKIAAKAFIAKALSALKAGGNLICIAANDAGGKTLEKTVKAFGVDVQSLSKSKSRVVVAQKNNIDEKEIDDAVTAGAKVEMQFEEEVYVTQPGIFGWNKIDRGSYFLVEAINDDLKGKGADFGCGYGYLAKQILQNHKDITDFYAVEADLHALECAKANLDGFNVSYLWEDLTRFSLSDLDFIVMNPPFHEGKKTDSDIGARFIENASKSLKKGGVLYMVANAHLPYENILNAYFSHIEKLQEQGGFKIFKAVK